MSAGMLLANLESVIRSARDRKDSLAQAAGLIRNSANYRWVGLYEVDQAAGLVRNVTWSGHGAPEYPTFPITEGLTSSAIAQRQSVNVDDVSSDPRYLTAFVTTRSEIIVPVFDGTGEIVVGTIDVESEEADAFSKDVQDLLGACSDVIRPLWRV